MGSPARKKYDVIIAGARCAGASTAMLLAERGLRVLAVDPTRPGSDTLSTHALMRGAVLQLTRWGLLDAVKRTGTPAIRSTTFHYGNETIAIPIKPRDGVDALYAPRRTVLDQILADAASEAGAEVLRGQALVDVVRDGDGRVVGARLEDRRRQATEVEADLVIGADGIRSRVARIVDAETAHSTPHAACSIYGYWEGLDLEGYHWFYEAGVSIGTIPTNDDLTCVFVLLPGMELRRRRSEGLDALHQETVARVAPELGAAMAERSVSGKLRGFAGAPGHLRTSHGPGWALVGDAGYFRDPITAHGITDALREAELLARAAVRGDDWSLAEYTADRDHRVRNLLEVTDRLASFEWDLEEAKQLHLALSREMNAEMEAVLATH